MLDHLDLSTVRAVALDVDGTLAGADSLVTPRTIRALNAVSRCSIVSISSFLLMNTAKAASWLHVCKS